MSHPNRKKTFVDQQVQGALVKRLVLQWLGFLSIASLIAFCLQVMTNPFRSFDQHLEQLWWTHGPFLLVLAFMLPVFVLDTVRLSNRFTGPIYRLRQTIRSLAQGKPTAPLKFRDFDFWQGLAEDFNHMIDRFENQSSGNSTKTVENEQPVTIGEENN